MSRPSTDSSPEYREIAILTASNLSGDSENYSSINNRTTGTAFSNVTDVATQFKNDYENMVASVDKYNGFYIGRYEVTENGEKPGISLAGTISNKAWTWYALYNKCLTLNKGTNTESSMMYGALWDATMQWLASLDVLVGYTENTANKYANYYYENVTVSNNKEANSTTIKVKTSGTSTKLQTGQTSYTSRKNIYDISGNCFDWTQEAAYTNGRVHRGGSFDGIYANTDYPSSRVHITAFQSLGDTSSRPQLYIK